MSSWSTYRVQFNGGFTFAEGSAVAGYLADLGISHLYCSPYLQAAPGSAHGYDVTDPNRLNEELGGVAGHARMVAALRAEGLGQILDIVPNHMAAAASNRWWWDVLEKGPSSRFARFFDIDWEGDRGKSGGKVLVPILGDRYGRILETHQLRIERDGSRFVVVYGEHRLPVSPGILDGSLAEPELEALNADADRLHEVLSKQHYRLAYWRTASHELNYRRFFSITTLVGLRQEDPEVFAESHKLVIDLVRHQVLSGLRVDHLDGLRDPEQYLDRLSDETDGTYTVVEKILEPGERLAGSWRTAGTTGYDFLCRVNNLFVESANERAVTELYTDFTGETSDFEEVVRQAKKQVMNEELAAEVDQVTALFARACERQPDHRHHSRDELRRTIVDFVAHFPVYRTYVRTGAPASGQDRQAVKRAADAAIDQERRSNPRLVEFLARAALGEDGSLSGHEFPQRLQQLTSPVMAKGVEDTAFYRYNRFVSLNEVGGDPSIFGRPVADFHAETADSARNWPDSMLTLSTHDTKRSADVRARLNVLSWFPRQWRAAVERFAEMNEQYRRDGLPDRNCEYLLYQSLVGAWPLEADRMVAFMAKATKESKLHTSWVDPRAPYDQAVEHFVRSILGDRRFGAEVERFLADQRVVELGRGNSLAQTVLLLTCPGVADLYQGSELWDLSLVDPDNRRPVDFDIRRHLLAQVRSSQDLAAMTAEQAERGMSKLFVVHRLLQLRRRHPGSFENNEYEPLEGHGAQRQAIVGFHRPELVVVVGCRGADWNGTEVDVPPGNWRDVLTGQRVGGGRCSVAALLGSLPAAVLAGGKGP